MSSKPVKGIRIKDGKFVRVRPFRSRIKEHKAAREVKAWEAKRK